MIHAHNPVMQRLGEMARLWEQKVKPEHKLIRWLLKPEDSRMYEGFCRLEASAHGSLDNLFVFFYTPFQSAQRYSHAIMKNWLQEYDDNTEQKQLLFNAGVKGECELQSFRSAVISNKYESCDLLLPQMTDSWRKWLGRPAKEIVLGLLPKEISSPAGFSVWINAWMNQETASGIQLLLFDYVSANWLGPVFEKHSDRCCTLIHDLRMQEAIREIATAGAATDPHAYYRKCLFEMGEAANKKNISQLHEWGQKAVETGKRSGDKNLLATAYISYAGMLFNFKDHEKIYSLLNEGLQLCKQRVAAGDEGMKSLLLQYYAYKGAHCQLLKERKEALQWFMRMGDEAVQFQFMTQAVSAYYKAFIFADHKNREAGKMSAMLAALRLTQVLTDEEIQSSEYPFFAYEFNHYRDGDNKLKDAVQERMSTAYGNNWEHTVAEMKKNYTKQRLRQADMAGMEK